MTRDEFTRVFRAIVKASDLPVDDFARELQTSRPTIERWVSGESAPHRVARDATLAAARFLAINYRPADSKESGNG